MVSGVVALALSLAACSKQRNHEERRLPDGSVLLECNVALRSCLTEAERVCRDQSYAVLGANNVVRTYGAESGESKVVLLSSSARIRCLSRGAEPLRLTPEATAGTQAPTAAKAVAPPPRKPPPPKPAPAPASAPRAEAANAAPGVHCVPGASQACVGPGGCQGGQVCLPDGSGLAPCDCGGAR
jgi:hypothetical protein